MGHWSVKCAISSLPIRANDDVVLLLGVTFKHRKGADTGGYVWQNHFFNLIAPPIFGKYNEYGWIEDADAEGLKFAQEAIQLIFGTRGDKRSDYQKENDYKGEVRVSDEMIDLSAEDVHWHDLEEQFQALVDDHYDYTFIHRRVWDEIINESARNFHGDFHLGYKRADDDQQTKDERAKVEAVLVKHGCKIGQYHPYGTPEQFFRASLELWEDEQLVPKRDALRQLNIEGMTEEQYEMLSADATIDPDARKALIESLPFSKEVKREIAHALIDIMLAKIGAMSSGHSWANTIGAQLAGWFKFASADSFQRSIDIKYVDKLIKLTNTNHRKNLMFQAGLMLNALRKSGLAIRGSHDLPSEQQDGGPYWAHAAIHRAVGDIMFAAAERKSEWADEPFDLETKQAAIQSLAEDGLDESYEFK